MWTIFHFVEGMTCCNFFYDTSTSLVSFRHNCCPAVAPYFALAHPTVGEKVTLNIFHQFVGKDNKGGAKLSLLLMY